MAEACARSVLLTLLERRRFAEERVPLLDLQARTLARWQELGPDGTEAYFNWLAPGESPDYPDGRQDNTHFRPAGAIEVARMTARALLDARVLAPRELRRLGARVPETWISWPPAA